VFAFVPAKLSGIFESERRVHLVGPYGRSHVRHFYQQSWYTMCLTKGGSDYLIQQHDDKRMTEAAEQGNFLTFTVPASERLVALKELHLMNINAFSLFGSEGSLIRTLATREFLLSTGN